MKFDVELVGKIGSMALIDKDRGEIDASIFYRLSHELKPGIIWVSSGATEIGRIDYIKRHGKEAEGDSDEIKTDYASQGQAILMQKYRQYIDPAYSVRQLLVEHNHFNNDSKRKHIKDFLLRAVAQNAVPIINYNDAVSFEENRKMEIQALKSKKGNSVVELVDNDETASQIACLVNAKTLVILTSVDGIYKDPKDSGTLIERICGKDDDELLQAIEQAKKSCIGASRAGANGAGAKLEYIKAPALKGTKVIIANSRYSLKDILSERVRSTKIYIG